MTKIYRFPRICKARHSKALAGGGACISAMNPDLVSGGGLSPITYQDDYTGQMVAGFDRLYGDQHPEGTLPSCAGSDPL